MRDLVTDLLIEWVDAGRTFTAYEVTAALRKAHPNTALPHSGGVRETVHAQMRDCLIQGQYTQRTVAFYRSGWAVQYVPVRRTGHTRRNRLSPCPPTDPFSPPGPCAPGGDCGGGPI